MLNVPFNLSETGEWTGSWWLPEYPNERVPGVLRCDGEGTLSLSLIGRLEDRIVALPPQNGLVFFVGGQPWDVIYGAVGEREITLFDCTSKSNPRGSTTLVEGPDKQTVEARSAIIGVHVSSEDDAVFSAVEVSVEDLTLWAGSSAFEDLIGTLDGKIDWAGQISVKPVETQSVVIDGTEYCLSHAYTLPRLDRRKGMTVGRMRDTAFIRVVPAEPFSLKAALKAVRLVQDLISLATHHPAGVIWLQLEVAGTESALPDGRPISGRRADVLYTPAAIGKHDAKAIDHYRVLFTCNSLPFDEVMPRSYETHSRLEAATNMVLGLRYAPASFVENNLLMAVGAAEVLHRNLRIDDRPFSETDFAAMREAMLAQVPQEHQSRFKGVIRNDPTLRDRLQALAARLDQKAVRFLIPDVDYWAKRTVKARNDLAHEGKTPNHFMEELKAVVDVTTAVVILNVLHELGLPCEQQRKIVQVHPQLSNTSRIARDLLVDPETGS